MDEAPAGTTVREGTIPFHGSRTWYRVVGDGEEPGKLPLLLLHGGPGATHHHMRPYQVLAEGRRVVLYDQLGCGRSAIAEPHDPAMFTTELFVEEIGAIRDALDLPRAHVFGHSWGGMLGMAYAVTRPPGLASLIVQSSPASVPFWMTQLRVLRNALPPEVEDTLRRHEAAGTTDAPEYEAAMMEFYRRHVCRTDPWPDWVNDTFAALAANPEVYNYMNGPSEFHVIGTIKDWDVTDRLARISVPTLLFCGRHDEVTPATMAPIHQAIAGSEFVVFEESSHMAQAEEPEKVLATVRAFLARVEAAAP